MFAFTDSKILAALKFKSANGVKVSGVVDAWNSASQLERFLDSGLEVSWSENATVHDKTFIIDAKTVVTGSANATLSGWGKNREIIAIIYSGELSREFIQHIEFRRSRDDN
jgi:phosphatidylserine/phosphatidylglycerophosphate/cardiolipin synthase-like enzyme